MCCRFYPSVLFFFNDTATTEIYTLSLHDALPICNVPGGVGKRFLLFASGVKIFCRRENRSRPDRRLQPPQGHGSASCGAMAEPELELRSGRLLTHVPQEGFSLRDQGN